MIIITYINKEGKEKTDFLNCINEKDIDHILTSFDKGEKVNIQLLNFNK